MAHLYKEPRRCDCGYVTPHRAAWFQHKKTCKYVAATHAAEATISKLVNDHSKKAKDDAWVRYMERKRLEGKKAWSKERWSKNYDQLEKARAASPHWLLPESAHAGSLPIFLHVLLEGPTC